MKSHDRDADPSDTARLVLIADDEAPIAEALAIIAEDSGYRTRIAPDGKQALEQIRRYHPALIFTDLMMPQLSGAQLIAAVHVDAAMTGQAPPPIVLMSAAGRQYAANVQADAFLAKPFDIEEVEALLARFPT